VLPHRRTRIGQELHACLCSEGLRAMSVCRYTTGSWPLRITKRTPAVGSKTADQGYPDEISVFRRVYIGFHR
jgi:hypothetical protein